MPEDDEELALTLRGKKKNISRQDFEMAMLDSGVDKKSIANIFNKFRKALPQWFSFIDDSFLPAEQKTAYRELIEKMAAKAGLLEDYNM